MISKTRRQIDIPVGLIEAIRSFPLERELEHCGVRITVSPFDFYAECPQCHERIKVRSVSGTSEVEDVFDAVFEWMNQPPALEIIRRRQMAIEKDAEE